jgi:hypothetical protein
MANDSTPLYMPGEYCDVCGATERLGKLTLRDTLTLTVCVWCHEDKRRVQEWLAGEMEKALEASHEYKRLPDGNWAHV